MSTTSVSTTSMSTTGSAGAPSRGPGLSVSAELPIPPLSPADVVVVAVDDHEAIREGVRSALEADTGIRVVAGAATVAELTGELADLGVRPEVALLDLLLADRSLPADNVARLRELGVDVIVYSSLSEPSDLRAALAAGALGAVAKSQPLSDLVAAIHSAARGEAVFTTEWAAALDSAPCEQRPALSDRESQALRLYASGLGMKSAARKMDITLGTYKEYLDRIRRKYALVNRPAATKLDLYHRAVEDGYFTQGLGGPDDDNASGGPGTGQP